MNAKTKHSRIKCLKWRQIGITTLECIIWIDRALWSSNQTVVITAHDREKQQDIFKKVKLAYENLPEQIWCDGKYIEKPTAKTDNKNELSFRENNSVIKIALDSRSGTLSNLHITELAFKRDAEEMMTGTLPSVPKTAPISVETTANWQSGVWAYFYKFWKADNWFYPLFISWFHQDEYSEIMPKGFKLPSDVEKYRDFLWEFSKVEQDNKLYWYYLQSRTQGRKMKQEYPTYPEEAFLTSGAAVFDPYVVQWLKEIELYYDIDKRYPELRIYRPPEPCVISIDTAGGSEKWDYTCIVWRNYNYELLFCLYDKQSPAQATVTLEHITDLWYHWMIAPEVNNTTGGQIIELLQASDTVMENHQIYRRRNASDDIQEKTLWKYWFLTGPRNRNEILDHMEQVVDSKVLTEFDERELHEMWYFVLEKNKRQASSGEHDDAIMSDAICCYIIHTEDIAKVEKGVKMVTDFFK